MSENKIGQLILIKRKKRGLTQQELGDILGVSSKTISKWECGNGLPDISILKKISKEFDITIEELLDGEIKTQQEELKENINHQEKTEKKSLTKKIIPLFFIFIILTIIVVTIKINQKLDNKSDSLPSTNNCTVIKTYTIKNIEPSNDGNYLYVTVTEYQVEGVFTVKLPRSISNNLKEGNGYIFTFKTDEKNIDVTTDILFDNSEIINIKYTDKVGMERESRSYCDKEENTNDE